MRLDILLGPSLALILGAAATSAYTGTTATGKVYGCTVDSCSEPCGTNTVNVGIPDTCEVSACTKFSAVTGNVLLEVPRRYITLPNGVTTDPYYGNLTCTFYANDDCSGTPTGGPTSAIAGHNSGQNCIATSTGFLSALCSFGAVGCSA